ncbi:MAG TPA: multidrug transporter subunit MdtA, partial [Pantoea agglomerans]|nr:multidrug transporter subunit MdtA [Pantoea agglomerans]
MTHLSRPARSFGLKWLLLLLVAAIVAGVIWRLLAAGHGPGEGLPSGSTGAHGMMGGGATLVHSGDACTADVPVWVNALGTA